MMESQVSKVFFVSRAFPPVVGGIENHNFYLLSMLEKSLPVVAIVNRHGKKFLPVFFLVALIRLFFAGRKGDVIFLGDGVLAPLGWVLKKLKKMRIAVVIHGLDVTYDSRIYQYLWVGKFIPSLDALVAVSRSTKDEIVKRTGPLVDVRVIPNGIDVDSFGNGGNAPELTERYSYLSGNKIVLLTVGRLVKRKGVEWFVREVMPGLPERFIYLVAGKGDERERIQSAIDAAKLTGRVFLLGEIADQDKNYLLRHAHYFVQPNIDVSGDVEGFGITVIEAGINGLMVVAADLQGLKDSVIVGETGCLLPHERAVEWREYLMLHPEPVLTRDAISSSTRRNFSWSVVIDRYLGVIDELKKK